MKSKSSFIKDRKSRPVSLFWCAPTHLFNCSCQSVCWSVTQKCSKADSDASVQSYHHSFINLIIHSFIHSFFHLIIHSSIHSFIQSFKTLIHKFLINQGALIGHNLALLKWYQSGCCCFFRLAILNEYGN